MSARPVARSAATWTSTTAADRIRALTTRHQIKPTSTRCHSAWQLNPGRRSTYRRGKSVQTTGTTSGFISGSPRYNYGKENFRIPAVVIEKREKLRAVAARYGVDLR